MTTICNSQLIRSIKRCFSFKNRSQGSSKFTRDESTLDNTNIEIFIETLRKHKDDEDMFMRIITKNPQTTLYHLIMLEDETDIHEFKNVIAALNENTIHKYVKQGQVLAYFYYLKLKVNIMVHHEYISIDSMINNTYDFSVDRVIAEFMHNLVYLKNLYKFNLFEDKDDRTVKVIIYKRMMFFEWLSLKLFKIFLLLSCNVDLCKDNKYLIQLTTKVNEYCDINERYFLNHFAFNHDEYECDKLKKYVQVYVRELLGYIKLLVYNREKNNPTPEYETLNNINKAINQMVDENPMEFPKLQKQFIEFDERIKLYKSKDVNVIKLSKKRIRRSISDGLFKKRCVKVRDSGINAMELDENFTDHMNIGNGDRLFTIKELSSKHDRQSSELDIADLETPTIERKYKKRPKRLSLIRTKGIDTSFI